jgi:lipopolysaccharide biosynthesis glycosyltransferase
MTDSRHIPQFCLKYLHSDNQESNYDSNYVLYADADVVFLNNPIINREFLPRYVGFATQGNIWCCSTNQKQRNRHFNSGVMIMNVTGYSESYEDFKKFILNVPSNNCNLHFKAFDQSAFISFFPRLSENVYDHNVAMSNYSNSSSLPFKYFSTAIPKIFEYEPYLGVNPDAVILHWHGPKFYFKDCLDIFDKSKDPFHILEVIDYPDTVNISSSNFHPFFSIFRRHNKTTTTL